MRYRLQRHDGTDCSATMVPFTVLRLVPIQRYCQAFCIGIQNTNNRGVWNEIDYSMPSYGYGLRLGN